MEVETILVWSILAVVVILFARPIGVLIGAPWS